MTRDISVTNLALLNQEKQIPVTSYSKYQHSILLNFRHKHRCDKLPARKLLGLFHLVYNKGVFFTNIRAFCRLMNSNVNT